MNLQELREAMSSDATKENEKLKNDLKSLKKRHENEVKKLNNSCTELLDDCRALSNRCFAFTKGSMCIWCELHKYHCPHALSLDEKIKAVKEFENFMGCDGGDI